MNMLLEAVALVFLVAGPALILVNYRQLPDQVPLHFNLRGAPDRWGRRSSIWLLPLIGLFVFALLTWIPEVAHAAAGKQQPVVELMLSVLKAEMLALFFVVERGTIRVALGERQRLDPSFWGVLLLVLATSGLMPLLIR